MKKSYLSPTVNVVNVKIEKGFAASADTFGIQNFNYDDLTGEDANTAW